MRTRRKVNKKITKSICLSERYWSILKEMAESSGMSNGDIVRDCIIATHFVKRHLITDRDFSGRFWDFFDLAKQIDESVVFERPEEPRNDDDKDSYEEINRAIRNSRIFNESFPLPVYKNEFYFKEEG